MSLGYAPIQLAANASKRTVSVDSSNILAARERLLLNTLPGDSDAYKRTCIFILLKTIQQNPNISTNNLLYTVKRFGYDEQTVEKYLNALNMPEFRLIRWWKNKKQRRTGYRFWLIDDTSSFNVYVGQLVLLHPELKAAELDLRLRKGA